MSRDAAPITTVATARSGRYRRPVASAAFDRRPQEHPRAPAARQEAIRSDSGEPAGIGLPIVTVQHVDSAWTAVLPIGPATAGHRAFPANPLPLPPDPFSLAATGSVVGTGRATGAIGSIPIATFVGYGLGRSNGYAPTFALAGTACVAAFAALHLASPRLSPLKDPVS